jgi:hypothetical protein
MLFALLAPSVAHANKWDILCDLFPPGKVVKRWTLPSPTSFQPRSADSHYQHLVDELRAQLPQYVLPEPFSAPKEQVPEREASQEEDVATTRSEDASSPGSLTEAVRELFASLPDPLPTTPSR